MRATTQSRTVFSRHYRFSALVSLLALSFGPSMSAVAQDDPIPEGDEFVVGTADQGSFAAFPRVGVHPAGNFIVVWEEFRVPGLPDQSRTGINAQIRDINGDPVGAQFQVNSTFEDDQRYPDIAIAPGGNFLVVWHERRLGDSCATIQQCSGWPGRRLPDQPDLRRQAATPRCRGRSEG